jgi:ribulose-phosphate 3-epimerase
MNKVIVPSILVSGQPQFLSRLRAINGHAKLAQLDVLNGTFLPNRDFHDPAVVSKLRAKLFMEIHLMVMDPEKQIAKWNFNWVKKIIFHIETAKNPQRVLQLIAAQRQKAGIALNPETPVSRVLPYIRNLDTLQIMTIHPGRNGAPFLPRTIKKISIARRAFPDLDIEVDGGMNPKTIRQCFRAGASRFVVGSYLINDDFAERLKELKQAIR